MANFIDSRGEIEIVSQSQARQFEIGDRIRLIFKPIDTPNPPYKIKVMSPSGQVIVDTIIRALPTGEPQSAPPFEFTPSVFGVYEIEIRETRSRAYGKGSLKIG